jgi:hypothetical protein
MGALFLSVDSNIVPPQRQQLARRSLAMQTPCARSGGPFTAVCCINDAVEMRFPEDLIHGESGPTADLH